ncbi:helix-turn-helix domain-containing protein [Micromonospora endolithica]|uniref:Helix-turn-helix domain-containing protein n=2 Tax=Micromonospora endolithica TaxID=230091 RepID=A0A3A9YNU1_9ACTN|nr:helix-turn-helix domain-containing protein [Micromonospora endolithica]RKN37680.1 helix-turn-helix domain-containing protein [Micromonospora endolithica]
MTTREVATLFGVHPKTVLRWVNSGTLVAGRTVGGHLRFARGAVREKLAERHISYAPRR